MKIFPNKNDSVIRDIRNTMTLEHRTLVYKMAPTGVIYNTYFKLLQLVGRQKVISDLALPKYVSGLNFSTFRSGGRFYRET